MAYQVKILDAGLNYKGTIRNLDVIDKTLTFLTYTQQLSKWGVAHFRVGTKDPLFQSIGDMTQPFANHVQILRDGVLVWQGVIARNKNRTPFYIDVEARTYEWYLSKILIRQDPVSPTYPDDAANFKHFDTGAMDTAISTLLTQAQADAGTGSFVNKLSIGSVTNPVFPGGYVDLNGHDISGQPWNFATLPLKFNFVSVEYVLNAFGAYSKFDFNIDLNQKLNFQSLIGTNKSNLVFSYGTTGMIESYNIPYDGDTFFNYILGLGSDDNGNVLLSAKTNNVTIGTYGKIMNVAAYSDIKAQQYLDSRTSGEVQYRGSFPFELQLSLNDSAYPIGQYNIGDIVTIQINDKANQFNGPQQIVEYKVMVKNTGAEEISLFTNTPLPATF